MNISFEVIKASPQAKNKLLALAIIVILLVTVIVVGALLKVKLFNPKVPVSSFVILATLLIVGYLFMIQAMEGVTFPVRKISAFDAIEEGVARSVEMGRPVHVTIGYGTISSSMAPQYVAGLGVLAHVARLAGKYGAKLIATLGVPEAIASVEELVRDGYYSAGRPELYNPTYNVRYFTDQQFAYASAVQATIVRENVGANIVVGPFYAESLIFMEAGNMTGAFQIAGTARETQIPFFVITADYAFIGEEIFAAGALASGDRVVLASIRGQDLGKLITIALVVLGIILLGLGLKLSDWLNWVWTVG
ncbi:MAG: hypothetical protein B7O98_04335 [Zestosphaera tikiterensis]|uniref:DUF6754 domain-containing protein n=1 Tax=Zestosphaera tikiterensis TaxID=1973259 RepID=A0A2R7Y7Z9_9CREN|nr:MAG: hypothetical protein B7O98_04335 [Zestosphaera tikiterensis]